jgi:hypothetical protein
MAWPLGLEHLSVNPSLHSWRLRMPDDELTRFLDALSPAARQKVRTQPRERQQKLAEAWEKELSEDSDLDTLDEVSPAAAEEEAAERIVRDLLEGQDEAQGSDM